MASYGLKYQVYCDHQFGGDSRYLAIYKKDYSGAFSELSGTAYPVILEYPDSDSDVLDPVCGSEITASVWNLTADQLIEFATARNRDYVGRLYNDDQSRTEWEGFLVPSEVESPWNQPPYEMNLIFNCGLGMLDQYDYLDTDGSYYTGRVTMMSIIAKILSKIYNESFSGGPVDPQIYNLNSLMYDGATLNFTSNIYSTGYLDQAKYINNDGTVWTCKEVLREIMEVTGARIFMGRYAYFYIQRIRDFQQVYDSYDLVYNRWNLAGTYQASGLFADTDLYQAATGIQARSTMVGWIESSQRVRYERAYRQIRITQAYLYTNVIKAGDFKLDAWASFWSTSGTITRVQSPEDPDSYAVKVATASYLYQEFTIEGTGTSPYQYLTLSFEGMVEHDNNYTGIYFGIYMTRDAPSAQYLVGQIGGASPVNPAWQVGSGYTYFTDEDGLPESGVWQKYELIIPYFPSTAAVHFRLTYPATSGSGSITGAYYRNVKVYGTYDGEPPNKENVQAVDVDENNTILPEIVNISLGDIVEEGNEGLYFQGAITEDAAGTTPTETWRSTRGSGVTRFTYGVYQSLVEAMVDNRMIQHGLIRKRLTGQMNNAAGDYFLQAYQEDSIFYLPTRMVIDFKRGEVDVSMVELPEAEAMGLQLLSSWTNVDMSSFSSTADLITAASATNGQYADHDEAISYKAQERFEISFEGTVVYNEFRVVFLGSNIVVEDGTSYELTAPSSPSTSTPRLECIKASGTATITNLTITVKKIYGY